MRSFVTVLFCAAALALLAACGEPQSGPTAVLPVGGSTQPSAPSEPASSHSPTPAPAPMPSMHDAVDDGWFSNTAMIGHSLMEGMRVNSGLDTPDYYTLVGASISRLLSSSEVCLPDGSFGSLEDALEGTDYEHVYLFMGINEIDGDLGALKSEYQRLLDLVERCAPDADIYVLAVLPVTRSKADEGIFTLDRITAYNGMLQELCAEQGCWYVDVYSFYADLDGYLPDTASNDGIHLYAGEYPELLRYIKRHTAQ